MTIEHAATLFLSGAFVSALMHAIALGLDRLFPDTDIGL